MKRGGYHGVKPTYMGIYVNRRHPGTIACFTLLLSRCLQLRFVTPIRTASCKSYWILQYHICSIAVVNNYLRTCRNAALDLGIEVKIGGKGGACISWSVLACTAVWRYIRGIRVRIICKHAFPFCEGWSPAFFHQVRLHFFYRRDAAAAS